MQRYQTGDKETRNWGSYEVTAAEYDGDTCVHCEKTITVNPGAMLSLQSHDKRYEKWTILQGQLIVILDGEKKVLSLGSQVDIATGAIHTMANLGDIPCIVHEVQKGECSEDDIHRYWDLNGRSIKQSDDPRVLNSIEICKSLMASQIEELSDNLKAKS